MDTSEHIDQLVEALSLAVLEFTEITRSKKVKVKPKDASKQEFDFWYAPLEEVRKAITPALSAHGLALIGALRANESGNNTLTMRLAHSSGQWMDSSMNLGSFSAMQTGGIQLSYARRYLTLALVNVQPENEDTDGNELGEVKGGRRKPALQGENPQKPTPSTRELQNGHKPELKNLHPNEVSAKASKLVEISAQIDKMVPKSAEDAFKRRSNLYIRHFGCVQSELMSKTFTELEDGLKGMILLLEPGMATEPDKGLEEDPKYWQVRSVQSDHDPNVQYLVSEGGTKCSCPGFSFRGTCKHLISTEHIESTNSVEPETSQNDPGETISTLDGSGVSEHGQVSTTGSTDTKEDISSDIDAFRAFLLQRDDPRWAKMFEDTIKRYPSGMSESAFNQTKTNLVFRINKEAKPEGVL